VCFYSVTKRFTDYTHVWLGIALGLAPIGAWLAVKGQFGFPPVADVFSERLSWDVWLGQAAVALRPIVLAVSVLLWLIGLDIIYALQDYDFDQRHKLHSLVVAWGPQNALAAAFIAHMLMWGVLVLFGLLCRFRVAYFTGLMFILGCLVLEHWLARRRSLKWIDAAFFKLNAVVSVVFFTVTLAEVVFPNFRMVR
jgi:4-hydroxybenzoate polyprenyltransferase